ncbi:MAG: hypothetical protein CMJ70_11090 [Planctomycetaceae bacterium]|nr:hypothetical protein [Planctomycetaceae bacterium]|tara:strand:- start:145 stop:834 length:690 start_codon:yes stop_codon:yes gene_type:complete
MQKTLRTVGQVFARHLVFPQLLPTHLAVVLLSASLATAQDTENSTGDLVLGESPQSSDEVIHDQLREFRTEIESVVAKGNWEDLRPFLSSNVVVVWLDGTQSHGVDEVIEYLQSKTDGENAIVDRFTMTTEVAELSDLYGQTMAIAYGTAKSSFFLRGSKLTIEGPWSTTMIKEANDWKLVSVTASVGAFDSPLLVWARQMVWIVGAGAALAGLIIGGLIGRKMRAAAR